MENIEDFQMFYKYRGHCCLRQIFNNDKFFFEKLTLSEEKF